MCEGLCLRNELVGIRNLKGDLLNGQSLPFTTKKLTFCIVIVILLNFNHLQNIWLEMGF